MSATADSSFIVALYLNEPDSTRADATCSSVAPPLLLTDWHRVEIANAFQRAVKTARITAAQAKQLWQEFNADIEVGRFEIIHADHSAILERTLTLTEKHTATLGTRSLDLIHVATALEIQAADFLSFDDRQRKAAEVEALNVMPRNQPL
jgi:predicted nucleic acid-binding protein